MQQINAINTVDQCDRSTQQINMTNMIDQHDRPMFYPKCFKTGIHDGSTLAPDNGSYENPASQTNTGPRVDTLRLASPSTHNFGLDVDESTICTDDARASRKSGKLSFLGYLQ